MSADHDAATLPMDVHRTTVDGVPVIWMDVPVPRVAVLMFGVGRARENAANGGISHLVEHLALARLTQQDYYHNGIVTGTHTEFIASGTDEELTGFFRSVTSSLADLPIDRLGMERRILRQEAKDRSAGIAGLLMWYRFGNQGHGLVAAEELGLGWLGPDPVASWSEAWFTRDNATMWLSGPPPRDLTLPLPAGQRGSRVPLDSVESVRFPAHLPWTIDRVSLSYLTERSTAAVVTLDAIARRAREVLRFERGLVYDVQTDYERLDATTAHCTLSTDCAPDQVAIVRDEILRAIDAIAVHGITADEARRASRTFNDGLQLPQSRLGYLEGTAFDLIAGGRVDSIADLTEQYASLDEPTTAGQLSRSLDSLLLCAPGDLSTDHRWARYEAWSPHVVEGRRFRPSGRRVAGLRLPARGPEPTLTVGDTGVTWKSVQGEPVTVRYADCVAYRHWDGDVRELWGADGFHVRIAPQEWHDGAAAVRIIDAAISPSVVSCQEHGIGAFEDPADNAPSVAPGAIR